MQCNWVLHGTGLALQFWGLNGSEKYLGGWSEKSEKQKEIVIPSHKLVPEKYIKIQVFVYYVV